MPGELSPGQLKSVENKGGFLITGGFLINISTDREVAEKDRRRRLSILSELGMAPKVSDLTTPSKRGFAMTVLKNTLKHFL